MAKKYYAVRIGRKPGVFESWDECRAQTLGFPGAVFKGFPTREDAERFVSGEEGTRPAPDGDGPRGDCAEAYVDGSYDAATKRFSCGAVLFLNGEQIRFSESFDDPDLAQMRNVAGEIKGAETVIRYCLSHGVREVTVFHDYQGVASWATGEWKTNREGTRAYAAFCRESMKKLRIRFQKVKGHSGDEYNDLADRLAKEALGIGGAKKRGTD